MSTTQELPPAAFLAEQHPPQIERQESVYAELLGRTAVEAAVTAIDSRDAELPTANDEHENMKAQLEKARYDIATADPGEQKKFGRYLVSDGVPSWLLDVSGERKPTKLVQKLYEKDEDGKYVVPDETFLSVLQWHSMNMQAKDRVYERDVFGPMKKRFVSRLSEAVAQGWLAPEAAGPDRISRIQSTAVHLYDGIGPDPGFRVDSLGIADAYVSTHSERPAMMIKSAKHLSKRMFEHIYTHETAHEITGYTTDKSRPSDREYGWSWDTAESKITSGHARHGLERLRQNPGDSSENRGLSLLNEATTDHFAQALLGRDVEKVQPMTVFGAYRDGLRLLKTLCEGGQEAISPALFINAMLEGNLPDQANQTSERPYMVNLQESLKRAFPETDVVEEISKVASFGVNGGISHSEMSKLIKVIRKTGRQTSTTGGNLAEAA